MEGDDLLRAVGQNQSDPITLADAEAPQRAGEPVDGAQQPGVRHGAPEEHERLAVREALGGVVEQLGQWDIRYRDAGRHAVGVEPKPRPLIVRSAHSSTITAGDRRNIPVTLAL